MGGRPETSGAERTTGFLRARRVFRPGGPHPGEVLAGSQLGRGLVDDDPDLRERSESAARTSPTAADAYRDAYDSCAAELARAGVQRGGSALDERTRSTVRGSGSAGWAVPGARLVGYLVIAARDQAAAETWARKAPPLPLAVEVRPRRANPHMAAKAGAPR